MITPGSDRCQGEPNENSQPLQATSPLSHRLLDFPAPTRSTHSPAMEWLTQPFRLGMGWQRTRGGRKSPVL